MHTPNTWQEQRDWLENHFGKVSTVENVPGTFISSLANTAVADKNGRCGLAYNGKDEAQSVRRLFEGVTEHGGSEHIIKNVGSEEQHVWIDYALNLRPWNPPIAVAA